MKILNVLEDIELVIVDLEVSMGDKKQNAPTLCARHEGKIIPLNSADDGRRILMKIENTIEEDV